MEWGLIKYRISLHASAIYYARDKFTFTSTKDTAIKGTYAHVRRLTFLYQLGECTATLLNFSSHNPPKFSTLDDAAKQNTGDWRKLH